MSTAPVSLTDPTALELGLLCASPEFLHHLQRSVILDDDLLSASANVSSTSTPGSSFNASPGTRLAFTLDTGSNVHVFNLDTALALFSQLGSSNLTVVGVSGSSTRADVMGHVVLRIQDPASGTVYHVDLGPAHGMRGCPLNLLSMSLLMDVGAVAHFERGNCYFQAHPGAHRIPFIQKDGLFELEGLYPTALPEVPNPVSSFSVNGQSYSTSGNLHLWHRRLRHMPKDELHRIFQHGLVDGFKLSGKISTSCGCDTCRQARIRRRATPRDREFSSAATFAGHTVSVDLKVLPYTSFRGDRYVVVYVDHATRLAMAYCISSKDQVLGTLKSFLADMARLGIRHIHNIQTDRGSEFFEQEGSSQYNAGRHLHAYSKHCADNGIRHTVMPVEMKEKLAEVFFRDHFRAVDCMLWEARLSPAFWADALMYSVHLFNNTPHAHLDGYFSPLGFITGTRPRWDRFRVFGADVYEHIPNDSLVKYPGVPRGRKLIFVGFDPLREGFKLFDPETRRYHSSLNCYFVEDFASRVDALRHHDVRRALLKRGLDQPVIIDDFQDSNSTAVRSLYSDPDALPPPDSLPGQLPRLPTVPAGGAVLPDVPLGGAVPLLPAAPLGGAPVRPDAQLGGALSTPPRSARELASDDAYPGSSSGPMSPRTVAAERVRQAAQRNVMLRPLRLLPVGADAPYTPEDQAFLRFVRENQVPLVFQSPNPKKRGSASHRRYLKYMAATSYRQALELGASSDDLLWDYRHGFIQFPKHEPDLPGHVFNALHLAADHGMTHVLQDLGLYYRRSGSNDIILARAFNARGTSFNQLLATVYEPEVLEQQLEDHCQQKRLAEEAFAKTLHSSSNSSIDFRLAPEPTRFEQVLPEVCAEHDRWREAMDDEITSMVKFGVYRVVPKSAAGNRQLLGARWVYKRKIGKDGHITRYRARLVAQGFLQRPFDSYMPDETYSPVVGKETLRLFLSVSAALDLHVYQCDVKAAFLQAPLSETIFMRAPPGYRTTSPSGEEEVWELHKAIYGLKQSSNAFYTAMDAHLTSNGFKPMLGDPCLYQKLLSDGRMILCCLYVDDLLFSVPAPSHAIDFLSMLRERFVIEEGEGKPADFILGMAVQQDLSAGTIKLDMAMAIEKLARGILSQEELVRSRGVDTPMLLAPLPRLTERLVSSASFDYLSVVGSLLHITNCVRVDVAVAVGILSRHAATPGPAHVSAVKRVVQYLYNTRFLGITYSRSSVLTNKPMVFERGVHPLSDSSNMLKVFADSDYATDSTRRSTMGCVIMLNGGPISWASTLGKTVATSTCEAEVNAAVHAAKEGLHVNRLLIDLGLLPESTPIQIGEDNSACIAQAQAGLRSIRNAKHYEVRLRFLQQLVVDGDVTFVYVPTELQLADFCTKVLPPDTFQRLRDLIMRPSLTPS